MGENMKVNINMIKNMDLVPILGKMVENMQDNGEIVNDMVVEKLSRQMVAKDKEFGLKMLKIIGLIKMVVEAT